jgi:hypothetical protein
MSPILLLLLLALAGLASLGWGPGHHLEFAERVHRRRRELLPRDVALLLGEQRASYFYGNIAADIINFKAYGGAYNHCHRWGIIEELRARAESPRQEAFVLGYLSHLAADTIAHNHFVPYHLARYARTKGLGHLYWEMSADRYIAESRWAIVQSLKVLDGLFELDELVNRAVPKKALPMTANKLIFNHLLLVSERDAWRRGMQRIHPIGRVKLTRGFLTIFQRAAVDRVRLALHPRGLRALAAVDPNGKEAQKKALRARQSLLHRIAPARMRESDSERLAAGFLEGMESPPRGAGS